MESGDAMETERTATVITANRLRDGRVVFLGPRGWSEDIRDATLATDEQERRALEALARQSVSTCEVIDPYPIAVVCGEDRPVPVKLRERLRISGPGAGAERGEPRSQGEHRHVSL